MRKIIEGEHYRGAEQSVNDAYENEFSECFVQKLFEHDRTSTNNLIIITFVNKIRAAAKLIQMRVH